MKSFKQQAAVLALLLSAGTSLFYSCTEDCDEFESDKRYVVTGDVLQISSTSAELCGEYYGKPDHYESIGIEVSQTSTFEQTREFRTTSISADHKFNVYVYGLQPKTKYYYRAFSSSLNIGRVKSFTTKEGSSNPTFSNWTSTNHDHSTESHVDYEFSAQKNQTLKFRYTVSSESGRDYFTATLTMPNGESREILKESGSKTQEFSYQLNTSGTYKLRLQYRKDHSYSNGADQVSVQNIRIE